MRTVVAKDKSRILNRALKKTRWTRTLTFILSLTGRGEEIQAGYAELSCKGGSR